MEVHKIDYGQRVYRGTLDAVRQVIIATMLVIDAYNGEAIGEPWISDRDEYVAGTTPSTGAQVAYTLDEPLEIPVVVSNLPIKSLSGYNHIESSTGEMEVEYITEEFQPLVDLIGDAITTPILDYDNAVDLTLPDATGYTYIMPSDGVIMSTSYGSVGSTRIVYNGIEISQAYMGDSWTTQYTPFGRGTEITIKRGAAEIQYVSGSWIKFIPYKNGAGGSTLQTTTPTRTLNLTKSAVTEEIPDEIKNAEYEEKPDVNEADDSAPTEANER